MTIEQQYKSYFPDLNFIEDTHTYSHKETKLIPVSTKISKFYEKFDKSIAKYSAKKWNNENPEQTKTEQEILAEWDKIRVDSATRGTKAHKYAQLYPNLPEPTDKLEKGIYKWFSRLPSKYVVIAQEFPIYTKTYEYAGTPDVILYNIETENLIILDWKTSGDIYKNYKEKKMLPPFDYLLDSPLNHYKVQLNNYKLIIETETPFKVEYMWIIWLTEDQKNVRQYYCGDLTKKLKKNYSNVRV